MSLAKEETRRTIRVKTYEAEGTHELDIKPELLVGMQEILKKADPVIKALMVDGNSVWIACPQVDKVSEMIDALQELCELFEIDEERCCFAPMSDKSYMKEFGAYYVER